MSDILESSVGFNQRPKAKFIASAKVVLKALSHKRISCKQKIHVVLVNVERKAYLISVLSLCCI